MQSTAWSTTSVRSRESGRFWASSQCLRRQSPTFKYQAERWLGFRPSPLRRRKAGEPVAILGPWKDQRPLRWHYSVWLASSSLHWHSVHL